MKNQSCQDEKRCPEKDNLRNIDAPGKNQVGVWVSSFTPLFSGKGLSLPVVVFVEGRLDSNSIHLRRHPPFNDPTMEYLGGYLYDFLGATFVKKKVLRRL